METPRTPRKASPIDGALMHPFQIYGIDIQICPATGGVWLQQGQLERLIGRVRQESLADAMDRLDPRRSGRIADYDHDDDDDDRFGRRASRQSGGRRSRLAELLDFD